MSDGPAYTFRETTEPTDQHAATCSACGAVCLFDDAALADAVTRARATGPRWETYVACPCGARVPVLAQATFVVR